MGKILYLDRSGGDLDDDCGMAFYWNRIACGRGIVPEQEATYFQVGRETHEDLAVLASMEDLSPNSIGDLLSQLTGDLTDEDKIITGTMEILYRRLGWAAAWGLVMEPQVRATFENVSTEEEIILDRSPLWIGVTPDRLLRHREGHYLVYKEYKSTITAGGKWQQSWPFKIQPHIGMAAIEEEINEKVAYTQIVGLLKGDYRSGRLSHPYVWAWRRGADWTHEYDKARGVGWEPAPVWDYPGGVVDWVTRCGEDLARSQFPHSAPVFLNRDMLDGWVNRKTARMTAVDAYRDACVTDAKLRQLIFEQRTSKCRPAFGDSCPYLGACWNATIGEEPLSHGFIPRTPHHAIEDIVAESNTKGVGNG